MPDVVIDGWFVVVAPKGVPEPIIRRVNAAVGEFLKGDDIRKRLIAIGLATDGAGSTRGPASCSGLVGLKATLGAVPYDTSRDTFGNNVFAGPLARTITDAAVMHRVLGGPSDKDPWSLGHASQPMSPKLAGESLSGVRIGYIELMANPRLAADVRANTLQALDAWRDLGAEVEPVTDKIDWIEYEGRVLYQAGFHVTCAQYLPKWQNQMDPVTLAFMERGSKFTLADFRNAQFARTALFRRLQGLFQRIVDAVVIVTFHECGHPGGVGGHVCG